MKRATAQMLCLMSVLLITAGILIGCGERGPKQNAQEDVEDGGDPTPEMRKKVVAYLRAVREAKDGQQERDAILSLVEWLRSVDRIPAVILENQHSRRRATMQDVKAYVSSAEPVSLTVTLACFPPRYESISHTFRDNKNIALLEQVLWFEETGQEARNRQP